MLAPTRLLCHVLPHDQASYDTLLLTILRTGRNKDTHATTLPWRAGKKAATLGKHQTLFELDVSYAILLALISADPVVRHWQLLRWCAFALRGGTADGDLRCE